MLKNLIKEIKPKREITNDMRQVMLQAASADPSVHYRAQAMIAKALTLPLNNAVLHGDIVGGIFEEKEVPPGQFFTWPKSFITADNDSHFDAFIAPAFGAIPTRQVIGDYIMVPTFRVTNGISASLSYIENANWDVVDKMGEVLITGHIRKKNDVGFHTLLTAAAARGVVVTDSQATAGLFTKRLVSVAKTQMARLGGGNHTSVNSRMLTDIYTSLEAAEDIRSWDLTQVDDVTRRQIYISDDSADAMIRVFNVNVHYLFEFGAGQVYQNYVTTDLAQSIGSDLEWALGLDLRNRDSFLMPVKNRIAVFPDPVLHRQMLFGMYSFEEYGCAVLDNRNTLLLSF